MNLNKIKEISKNIEYITDNYSGDENYDQLKTIFLNLMELLGYDETKMVTPGFVLGTETIFDICLKTDTYDVGSDYIYICYEEYNSNISNSIDKVKTVVLYNTNIEDTKTKYYLISNGVAIQVYSNKAIGSCITNIKDLGVIDLRNIENNIDLLEKFEQKSQEILNYEQEIDEDLKIEEKEIKKETKIINKDFFKSKINEISEKINLKNKDLLKKIGLISIPIIFIIIIFNFLFFDGTKNQNIPNKINEESVSNESENNQIDLNKALEDSKKSNDVNYLSIKSILDLQVTNEKIDIKFISDLPENTIVKLGIFCGNDSSYIYFKTLQNGTGNTSFDIPSTWSEEKITVAAYLKFDEDGYIQNKDVIKKYGENGKNIKWDENYSKNMLTYSEVLHSNELVKAFKKDKEKKEAQSLSEKMKNDFINIDTRIDSFGNIKHIPKGYKFDESNISEKTNIYPMIFYDKEQNKSYFYIVCGYVGTQFLRFEKVYFSADGYNWAYDNSTNEKKNTVSGIKKSEWIYFNNNDTNELLGDMQVLSNSKKASISLIGSINKTYSISDSQKQDIKNLLYIYNNYYDNGNKVIDTSYFKEDLQTLNLNYIKKPNKMYERGYKEINSLNEYNNKIEAKKANGENITKEETELLDKLNVTYRVISDSIQDKIMNEIYSQKAVITNNEDLTSNNYMRIYFDYDNNNLNIEDGYISYIDIFEDLSVILPIKESLTNTDNSYVKFYINENIYNELKTYFDSLKYTQILKK